MTKRKKRQRATGTAQAAGATATHRSSAPPADAGAIARRRQMWAHLSLLVVISIAAYALTLGNGFVTDDNSQILMNPNVKHVQSLGTIFGHDVWSFAHEKSTANGVSNYYRPLQILVYEGEYAVFGESPLGWHAVNIALNAAVVAAAYLLIAALGGAELALWATLLFALHPMHIEAVAWIAALPELQCGLLMIVALIFYHRARSGKSRARNIAFSAFAYLAALFTKETALLFPAILLSYEYFYRRESLAQLWRSLRWIWPHLAALQLYIVARLIALGSFAPLFQPARAPLSRTQLLFAVPAVLERYVGKLIVPIGMNYFYAFAMPSSFGIWTITGYAVLAAIVVGMFLLRAHEPLLAFCVAWFLLTLMPALSLNRIGENFFTERYLFIPSLGFCVLVAWAWIWIRRNAAAGLGQRLAWGAGAAVLVFNVVQVERRIPVFRDDFTLLRDTAIKSPNSGTVDSMLAAAFYERGDLDKAIEYMRRAIEFRPDFELGLIDLAQYYSEEKKYGDAIEWLKVAVALHPQYDVAWINLAKAYTDAGDWQQAAICYRKLAEIAPDRVDYFRELARMAESNARATENLANLEKNAEQDPRNLAKLVQIGDAYARANRWAEAAAALRRAAKENPGSLEVWTKLGICLDQERDSAGAIDAYEHALAVNPDFLLARKNLARALAAAGRTDDSIAQFEAILAKNPGYEHADEVHYELGLAMEKKGDPGRAEREYELALQANPKFADAKKHLQAIRGPSGGSGAR